VNIIGDAVIYAAETEPEPKGIEYRLAYYAEISVSAGFK